AAPALNMPDLGEGMEFLTNSGALKIERVRGQASDAALAMQRFCRSAAVAAPLRPADDGEAKFVAQLTDQTRLEESGEVALYQPRDQTSMVIAVDRSSQRIVGWSFALPTRDGVWSVYHFQPAQAAGQTP